MDKQQSERKPLPRAIAAVLTIAFMGFIFTVCGVMLVTKGGTLLNAVRSHKILLNYMPEDHTALEELQARVLSFQSAIAENMWLKEEMGYLNSRFQYALGKKVVNTGSQNMIKLTTGHLYDLTEYKSLLGNVEDIAELRETQLEGLPFLFVYEHPTLYAEGMIPSGYEALDHSAQMADEATSALRDKGITVMDSRDVLLASGYALDDLLMVTDQHWTTLSAITMARSIAGKINEMIGSDLNPDLIDPATMNTLRHEDLFLGKYGQRIGASLVTPDDIVEYWPTYDTHLVRHTQRGSLVEEAEGEFRQVATRFDRLDPEPGKSYNIVAYTYYGQVEAYHNFYNPDAPDVTILLFKDSYSAPIGTFMSLLARNVIAVDLRQDVQPPSYWVEQYHPDVVVMAYSLQMLRDDDYKFN